MNIKILTSIYISNQVGHTKTKMSEEQSNESKLEGLKSQVQTLSAEDLLVFIKQLEGKWCLDCKNDPFIPITNAFKQFFREDELDASGMPVSMDIERVAEQHRRKMAVLGELFHRAVALNTFDEDSTDINDNEFKVSVRINRLIDMADDATRA